MLYHLFQYFQEAGIDFPGVGLMQYITFRAIAGAVVAILTAMIAGHKIIGFLQKKQIGETIRDLGLEGQMQKKGTPTMGGVIIIISLLVPVLLFGNFSNINTILLTVSAVWLGITGLRDDYIKVFKHDKNGMSGKHKLESQMILGLVVALTLCFSPQMGFRTGGRTVNADDSRTYTLNVSDGNITTTSTVFSSNSIKTTIPFVKNNEFDYRWLSPFDGRAGEVFTCILYILVIIFIITACSNGTNLSDGMDGLATGITAIVGITLGVLAYLSGHVGMADYLKIMYIPNSGEITVFMVCLVGALLGFLWYNSYPAQVFMGDTGSLMLGGVIGVCAVLIRKELLLPILCGVFLAESVSVIMQTCWFKFTRKKYGKGVRLFRMAPLHHHYQKENPDAVFQHPRQILPENKIVVRFWIISVLLAVLSIITLKIR